MKTVKLDISSIKLEITSDDFWKLTYTGVSKFGDQYDVSHEIPRSKNGSHSQTTLDINSLLRTVLSEAAQLYGR